MYRILQAPVALVSLKGSWAILQKKVCKTMQLSIKNEGSPKVLCFTYSGVTPTPFFTTLERFARS